MQVNDTEKMALQFNKIAGEKLEGKVDQFCILDIHDAVNNRAFSIEFIAYDYFPIRLDYDKGRFGCCIMYGDTAIGLNNSQKWWDEADFDIFFDELKEELELRIPDKYLKAHGWI